MLVSEKKIVFLSNNFWVHEPCQRNSVSQSKSDSYQDSYVEMTECFFQETSYKQQNMAKKDLECNVLFAAHC